MTDAAGTGAPAGNGTVGHGRPRVLCVDDEPELLSGVRLVLRKRFAVTTAGSGAEALALLDEADGPPFDAVVSDMRMPQMSGAVFLTEMRRRHPEVPRLLLTGQADIESAIAAVNEAKIFRFLTKPCPPDLLIESLDEAVEQARLRTVESELLDRTLKGTVSMLTDVLGLVSTGAYSRTMRLREVVGGISAALERPVPWELDLATMLSQIGFVVLPVGPGDASTIEVDPRHAQVAADLLQNVPRLGPVAEIIRHQLDDGPSSASDDPDDWPDVALDTEILRVAVHFDRLVADGASRADARKALQASSTPPPAFLTRAIGELRSGTEAMVELSTTVDHLAAGMELTADVTLATGPKLAGAGTILTTALIGRIRTFAASTGVVEPIHVLAPASAASKARAR